MYLQTDEQTIDDLGIFGKRDGHGIYDIYNNAHTRGGEALLEVLFKSPLSDKTAINQRSNTIAQFMKANLVFPFDASIFDVTEKYLFQNINEQHQTQLSEKEVQNGVSAIIDLLHLTQIFVERNDVQQLSEYINERTIIEKILSNPAFEPALKQGAGKNKISYAAVTAFDSLFRAAQRIHLENLLKQLYQLDVYIAVARTATDRGFVFPRALSKGKPVLALEGVYHPTLTNAVRNNVRMDEQQNVIFLTGANMAGKSTMLRSLSTALYIAHMGFPVAANSMEFSVLDGLYTTVNLPDNLGIGASHFYAEVLRVKKMASELSSGKSLFILFDELFRGTNVKDAHEATVAVTRGFAGKSNSLFIISSHIVEAGEELKQQPNIGFLYLPTKMKGHAPEYTYTLEKGITDDRHGMIIIRNEGILETLKNGKKA
ncbi:MutS-related protein [Pseudobacter ginsenosidimutans]|uniref:MutS-like protein n=1 Tax=Pseudobacter ginsenosidimutans TaxID=661488 RepID=A0A4Q7N0U6_9BACT|nr:DNA mismatch repair protein [Pseudobacter ginsenosidimutans]QEC43801.1 DNA mismatch repair protein [Pseudobacter ginsenosidimutans]RZS75221.1 MutS-like protein [Pseudobacter ginsenosidimutans]